MTILRDISFLWSMLHIVILFLILFEPRYSWRTTLLSSFTGMWLLLAGNVLVMFRLGHGIVMNAAFFTCTLPSLLFFFVFSKYRDGRFFFLFCLSDTTCFWLLQITNLLDRLAGGSYVVLFFSRLLVFPVAELLLWRFFRQPYRQLQQKLDRGWWLFAATGAIYYLLIMLTAIPVDAPMPGPVGLGQLALVMALMPLTYFTILTSLWRQMRFYESSRQMELQRRNYETIHQKVELDRIYRHDMRHHLTTLQSFLQQGETDSALQYVGELTGKLDGLTQKAWCSNPTVNAVLTAYLTQAQQNGCLIDAHIQLPTQLPFAETDLCVVLANPLENAIQACQSLPPEQRRIDLDIQLTDNQRLAISIENPCPQPVSFGPNGLPDTPHRDGHGIGLSSVQAVAEKYGDLFRCQWKEGRFLLRVVLVPPDAPTVKHFKLHRGSITILAVLLALILLNTVPALADTLEAIPILGQLVQVVDLRTYPLFWSQAHPPIH